MCRVNITFFCTSTAPALFTSSEVVYTQIRKICHIDIILSQRYIRYILSYRLPYNYKHYLSFM